MSYCTPYKCILMRTCKLDGNLAHKRFRECVLMEVEGGRGLRAAAVASICISRGRGSPRNGNGGAGPKPHSPGHNRTPYRGSNII